MCSGYLSQISFLLSTVQTDANVLEAKVVDGVKCSDVLEPLIQKLGKSISSYQTGMRTIKNVLVSRRQN